MARPLRIEFAGALYHVISRGNEQRPIFREDADYIRFLELFALTVTRFGWIVYSWVLMTNHFHLEICTPEPNLARGMHWLNGRYVQWFNRKYRRSGHLLQSRYKGILVEGEAYLLGLARYIVRNPVRAGMVERAGDYRWSSYRATMGLSAEVPACLDGTPLLRQLGKDRRRTRQTFAAFVAGGDERSDAVCRAATGQIFLGGEAWLEKIAALLGIREVSEEIPSEQVAPLRPRFADIEEAAARVFDRSIEEVKNDPLAQKLMALIAFDDGLYRQTEIARAFGLPRRSRAASLIEGARALTREPSAATELLIAIRGTMKRRPPDLSPPPSEFSYPFHRRRPYIAGTR